MGEAKTIPRKTRIQAQNEELILKAALEVFSAYGFRGATVDQIATSCGLSKPNLLYYFRRKNDIYVQVLRRTLDSLSAAHHGVVGYSITNLDTGEHLEQRGNETFSTASLIKVPVLVTLFDLAEQKQLTLDDPIVLTEIDKVGGAGQLQYLRTPLTLRLWDVAYLMSTLSDNTATNLVLDRIKIRRVWQKMEALGLAHTKVHSGSMTRIASVAPDSSAKYGLGVTTPNEMAQLFVLLAQGKAVSPTADSTMLGILANNEDNSKLARYTYGTRLAHKSGDVDASRTDCGVFSLPTRVVACVLTKENTDTRYWVDAEGNAVIGRIGEAIVRAWK